MIAEDGRWLYDKLVQKQGVQTVSGAMSGPAGERSRSGTAWAEKGSDLRLNIPESDRTGSDY